jgi:two-component sensor histidine kinase
MAWMRTLDLLAKRRRTYSTRFFVFGFVVVVLIPLLLFAGFLIALQANEQRRNYEENAIQTARQSAQIVEGELAGHVLFLRGLATSSALARDDFAAFYDQAKRVVRGRDETIVLRELGPRQIVNTSRNFGDALPPAVPISDNDREQFNQGWWLVSNVYLSPTGGDPRIAVALPIMREGKPVYILATTLPTARIRDALSSAVAQGWLAVVADKAGTLVTRSAQHDEFSGKPGRTDVLERATRMSGTLRTEAREGTLLLMGYYRSYPSGWLFGASIPEAVVAAPLHRSLGWLIGMGSAAVALSCLLAYLVGTTIIKASSGLAERAAALGQGKPVDAMDSQLADFVTVGEALESASAALDHRSREREKSDQQRQLLINELDHRVKNTLATVQSIVQQTLRTQGGSAQANAAVSRRLVALARVHDVLTRESWEGANLHEIVADIRSTQSGADKIRTEGPAVWLSASLALSLSLAINELSTNAIKYGALSRDNGFVDLTWKVSQSAEGHKLLLRWAEHGGPTVSEPSRQGFGMRLLQRSLSDSVGGTVQVEFRPEGLVCVIEAAIPPTDATPASLAVVP